jgi:hypothetical protein
MGRFLIYAFAALLLSTTAALAQGRPATPPVSSEGQRGGVTAGSIGSVTQQFAPPLVRGPLLTKFQAIFTAGATNLREMKYAALTDDQIDQHCNEVDTWTNNTYSWIKTNVNDYAAERFLFHEGFSFSYVLQGDHKPGYSQKFSNCVNALTGFLSNIDMLMRDPAIYPDK